MSTTLWPIIACVALLVATGWWIGRQFANDVATTGSNHLTLVMTNKNALGCDTVRHLTNAARDLAPYCVVTVREEQVEAIAGTSLHLEHFKHHDGNITVTVQPPILQTNSAAIRRITFIDPPVENDWRTLTAIILANGGIAFTEPLPDRGFEQRYLSAWRTMHRALEDGAPPQTLECAHRQLRDCIEDWPEGRNSEKPVALANLARVCLAMPKTPATRIPRLLEGLDAAREALRSTYDVPKDGHITGLRALLNGFRHEIGRETDGQGEKPGHATSRIPSRAARHIFASETYPHHGHATGHGGPRIRP